MIIEPQRYEQAVRHPLAAALNRAVVRYACAGAAGTALHYVLLWVLLDGFGAVTASTIGAIAGGLVNYRLAASWVFAGRGKPGWTLPKFATVAVAAIGVNAAVLSIAVLSLPVFAGQLVATGCAFLAGFVLNDLWSFRERVRQTRP